MGCELSISRSPRSCWMCLWCVWHEWWSEEDTGVCITRTHTHKCCAISAIWLSPWKPLLSSWGPSSHTGKPKLVYISYHETWVFGLKNPFWSSWTEKVKPALELISCLPLVSTFGELNNWAKKDWVISSEFIGQMIWKTSACPSGSLPCV